MATFYSRIIIQNKFLHLIIFPASFHKFNEEDQSSDESEFFNILKINTKLTESDIDNIDVKSELEHQIQIQETKESG